MKLAIRSILPFVLMILIGLSFVDRTGAQDGDARALFNKRCSKCHGLDRTNRTETPDNWRKIVFEMKNKWFSGISDQEAEIIADYLANTKGAN